MRLGFHVFPVYENSKIPQLPGFPQKAAHDPETLQRLWGTREWNVGISTTRFRDDKALLVVDVDVRPDKNGFESLEALDMLGYELPPTLTQVTPSGGRHLIYWVEKPVSQSAGLLGKGLDTRSDGGYIVGASSTLNGKEYAFEDESVAVARAPDWLIERHRREVTAVTDVKLSAEINQSVAERRARAWLEQQPPVTEGGRNDAGYRTACRLKDIGLEPSRAIVVIASHWRCEPMLDLKEIEHVVGSAYSYGQNAPGVLSPEAAFTKVPVDETAPRPKDPLTQMNDEFALAMVEGDAQVLWFTTGPDGQARTQHLSVSSFRTMTANRTVMYEDGPVPLSKLWLAWKDRRTFDGIVFEPAGCGPRFYNKWQGFTAKPKEPAAASKAAHQALADLKRHILVNVCAGNQSHADWIWAWFAHMIQRPEEKVRTALAMRGLKGVGKSVVLDVMGRLLGDHYMSTASSKRITGNFNSHLEGKLMLTLEEAFWSGSNEADSILKDLITSERMWIERKGREVYDVKNLTRIVILGNADWIVPATEDERRYAVFDVGTGQRGDAKYFGSIKQNMDYGLLMADLMAVDLSLVDINKIPETEALVAQKLQSNDPVQRWWFESLVEGEIKGRFDEDWVDTIKKCEAREAMNRYLDDKNVRSQRPSDVHIGRKLHAMCPALVEGREAKSKGWQRTYRLPNLEEARAAFESFIGQKIPWANYEH